tara:strand:- start:565 stop:1359 length:795 start_codon:yes stop_codon:yes gene_type:complete
MKKFLRIFLAFTFLSLTPLSANAIFGDDEAREAILDLRKKVETLKYQLNNQIKPYIEKSIEPILNKLNKKADSKSLISLIEEIESLKNELANLRGAIEVMNNNFSNIEIMQKKIYKDMDIRIQNLEPQLVNFGGKKILIDPKETKDFSIALSKFKDEIYGRAGRHFKSFIINYPESVYLPDAYFWLGSSYFAVNKCSEAIKPYNELVMYYPESSKAPEALLNVASCQHDLKDKISASKTLSKLIKKYPTSKAAKIGEKNLAELK